MNRFYFAGVAAFVMVAAAQAQSSAIHRTTLQEQQFPNPNYHTVTVKTVIDPGGAVTAHIHPGAEMAYVESGTATLTVAGTPPQTISAGGSFTIVQGTVHSVTNAGTTALSIVSTYVVERGKPVASPVP